MKVLVDGKQDDAKVVKVVGVAVEQNNDKPNVLEGNGVIGVGVNKINKWVDKEVQYSVSTLHGPVAEYQSEFETLINRITGISEYLLKMFYISRLKLALQIELLRAILTTLGKAFSLARITEARFEAIVHKAKAIAEKEQSIKETTNTITSLRSKVASPELKGSLDVDEDIGVDEVSSTIDCVFDSGESNVESMKVRNKFGEFSENKESVEEVVVSGGEALGVDEDEPNKVISVLKDGGGEFDDNKDEINLGLREECVIRVLEDRDVSGENSREVFSITSWASKGGRRVLCYVQGSIRRKRKKSIGCNSGRRDYALLEASVFSLFNPGPGSFAHKRIWDPKIKIVFIQHLEGKVVSKEWRMLRPGYRRKGDPRGPSSSPHGKRIMSCESILKIMSLF
ncbi:hypothetical protein Tco_0407327 [Tanacetum coccineum]